MPCLYGEITPTVVHDLFPGRVFDLLVELGSFSKDLCSKVLLPEEDLDNLEGQIALTLCKLKFFFLPFFYNIMVHLFIHLAQKAKIAGPKQFR